MLSSFFKKKIYLYNNERISYIFLNYGILKFEPSIKKNSLIIMKSININDYILTILINDLKKDNFSILISTIIFKILHKLSSLKLSKNIIVIGDYNPSYFHLNISKISNLLNFKNTYQNKKFFNQYKKILNKKYICFSFRDSNYLKKISNINFSYLSYRNFDPQNLLNTLNKFSSQNSINCFRIGKYVDSKLKTENKFIIDYAFNFQNDIDDLILIKNSFLNICDSSGIIYLGHISMTNTLRINCNINDLNHPQKNTISIPVKYLDLSNNKFLTYRNAISKGIMKFTSLADFKDNKIQIIPNSSEEILDTINLLISKNIYEKKIDDMSFDNNLNNVLHGILSKYTNDKSNNYNSRYGTNFKSKISEIFLKKNYELLS